MKSAKTFFYIISLLYIATSFVFVFLHERILDLFDQRVLNFLKIWIVVGLAFFLMEIIWEKLSLNSRRREANRLQKEIASLKAKMYDMEEKERENEKALKSFESSLKSKE